MKSLGICIGSSSISYVTIQLIKKEVKILNYRSTHHDGDPYRILKMILDSDTEDGINRLAVTGRNFKNL